SLLWTQPRLGTAGRVRVDVRASFTDETTLKFYGVGNATPRPPPTVSDADREYGRIHPTLAVETRVQLRRAVYLQLGSVYTQNWLSVRPTSLLAAAMTAPPPDGGADLRPLLGGTASHGVELLEIGLQYDSRDNDIVTHSGMFHALQVRLSPRLGDWLPYGYERVAAS